MALPTASLLAVLLLCASDCCAKAAGAVEKRDGKVQQLLDLQRKSKTGLITLDVTSFAHFTTGTSRSYSLFVMADARQFRRQGKLDSLLATYATAARAFAAAHAGQPTEGKAFFAVVVFEDSREVFNRLGVKSLPFLVHIPPSTPVKPSGPLQLSSSEAMTNTASPWSPQDVAAFFAQRTGLSPGDIAAAATGERSRFLPLLTLAFVGGACAIGWRLYNAPIMRYTPLYAAGALVIYWFSVSGGMYNIIRGVPFVGYDRRTGTAQLFMSGSGQVGAEGFIMGSFFLAFGLGVAGLTHLVPTIKEESARRTIGYLTVTLIGISMRIILGGHSWKTGLNSFYYF